MLMVPSTRGFVGMPGVLYPWPYFVAASQPTTYGTKGANISLPVPANSRNGDLLLAILYCGGVTPTPPSGWASMGGPWENFTVFYGFWNGSTTPVFNTGLPTTAMGAMCSYRNVDTVYTFDYNSPQVSQTNAQTSQGSYNILASPIYATAGKRTMVVVWLSLMSGFGPSSVLPGPGYQPDIWVSGEYGISTYPPGANMEQQLTRTDNASYIAQIGVADLVNMDATHGNTAWGNTFTYTPGTVQLNNYLNSADGVSYLPDDGCVVSMMLLAPGGVPGSMNQTTGALIPGS